MIRYVIEKQCKSCGDIKLLRYSQELLDDMQMVYGLDAIKKIELMMKFKNDICPECIQKRSNKETLIL